MTILALAAKIQKSNTIEPYFPLKSGEILKSLKEFNQISDACQGSLALGTDFGPDLEWAAMSQFDLSARSYRLLLKFSRTIEEFQGSEDILSVNLVADSRHRPKLITGYYFVIHKLWLRTSFAGD